MRAELAERFAFAWERSYRLAALGFAITPANAWVQVSDGQLDVRFGPWRLSTTVANVADVQETGPYAFLKTAGPPHLGWTDRGLTFASNGRAGLQLSFGRAVGAIEPTGLLRHPELTVTVADLDGLAAALRPSANR